MHNTLTGALILGENVLPGDKKLPYLSVMTSLQDATTVTPAAVAKEAWMAETSLGKQSKQMTSTLLVCRAQN